jgi:hypothetical protein
MQTDRHSTRRPRGRGLGRTTAVPFQSAPEDMVVGITFLLRDRCARAHWKKVVTTVSHRALFSLACPDVMEEDGVAMVRWEEWGPKATRIIVPSSFQWITAHAGQRWLSLESDNNNNNNSKKLVIRDFSAARVRRASQSISHSRRSSSSSSFESIVTTTSRHGGGENRSVLRRRVIRGSGKSTMRWSSSPETCLAAFAEPSVVVSSELPFIETCVESTSSRAGCMVLTDGSRLVAFVQTVS